LKEIARCSGQQFDPDLAAAFGQLDFTEFDRMVREHQAQEVGQAAVDAVAASLSRRSERREEAA